MAQHRFPRITVFALLASACALSGTEALAKKKKEVSAKKGSGSSYKVPYGMAGCGLGSLVLTEDTVGSQITAATLNGTGFQTSAISCTESSNCQVSQADLAHAEQQVFIAANLRALETEISSGGGDFSFAFAQVLGCDQDETYGEFLEVSRAHYRDIFASSDPKVVHSRYVQALRTSAKLVDTCARIVKA